MRVNDPRASLPRDAPVFGPVEHCAAREHASTRPSSADIAAGPRRVGRLAGGFPFVNCGTDVPSPGMRFRACVAAGKGK